MNQQNEEGGVASFQETPTSILEEQLNIQLCVPLAPSQTRCWRCALIRLPTTPTYHAAGIGGMGIIPVRVPVHAHSSTVELNKGTPCVFLLLARPALTWAAIQTHVVLAVNGLQLCQ